MDENASPWILKNFPAESVWISEILLGIFFLVLANFVLKRFLQYFRRHSKGPAQDWREKIDHIFYRPLHIALWIMGVGYVLDVIGHRYGFIALLKYLIPLRNALVICCFGWLLIRWKKEMQHFFIARRMAREKGLDTGMAHAAGRLLTIIIVLLTLLIVLQILGVDIAPLIAFGGIGAAAIGFAGKDVIANYFGGFMLAITRPFTIGDQIILPEKQLEGTVEEIGWYLTSVIDKQKRPVYLPNAMFSTMMVVNNSRMSHRRIEEKIGIRYKDFSKLGTLVDALKSWISSHPRIDKDLPIIVSLNGLLEYSLEIYIDVYTLETNYADYFVVKQQILQGVYDVILQHGAEMPFPTQTIELVTESS